MTQVNIGHELLRWAQERSERSSGYLRRKFPKFETWERGTVSPTLKQLEEFPRATHTLVGKGFFHEPPVVEEHPETGFLTYCDVGIGRTSPDLLDTLYLCQQRQGLVP